MTSEIGECEFEMMVFSSNLKWNRETEWSPGEREISILNEFALFVPWLYSYTGGRPTSNMVIVDVKMVSGFIPVKTSVKKVSPECCMYQNLLHDGCWLAFMVLYFIYVSRGFLPQTWLCKVCFHHFHSGSHDNELSSNHICKENKTTRVLTYSHKYMFVLCVFLGNSCKKRIER